MDRFDAIVVGLGGMGSAVLHELARRGVRVLGIEPNGIAHDRGSSHGQTRMIRKAYFEHPSYVPLVERSFGGWEALESASGQHLLDRAGFVLFGNEDGEVIQGVQRAAREHELSIEALGMADVQRRLPMFRLDEGMVALWEHDAGILHVETCVRTFIEQAQLCGASVALGEAVVKWEADSRGISVTTDDSRYGADRLIFCAGAWTGELLAQAGFPIEVRRKVVLWFEAPSEQFRLGGDFPTFCFDTPRGFFYGFPALGDGLIKVGEHSNGLAIQHPGKVDGDLHDNDSSPVLEFMARHLPNVATDGHSHSVCMYSMTPDTHFILDFVPGMPNVIVAAGFSGHGFKFAPVVGSILADLAQTGSTQEPISFLSANRQALWPSDAGSD